MITKEVAVGLRHGQSLYHVSLKNADGKTPVRCRVSGQCKTWKTRPTEFKLPVKHGLYTSFYITEGVEAACWVTDAKDVGVPS